MKTISELLEELEQIFCKEFCKYTEECSERLAGNEDIRDDCPLKIIS